VQHPAHAAPRKSAFARGSSAASNASAAAFVATDQLGGFPTARVPPVAAPVSEVLDNEILAIQRALDEHGPTERQELADLVGARYWGPGVFRETLREATANGDIRRASRNTYAPADPGDDAKQ